MGYLIQFSVTAKDLTLFHCISFTQEQLCTRLATDRVYIHYDIILNEANKITAFSYLYENTGNSASQKSQAFGSCAITNQAQITGCIQSKRPYSVLHSCWYIYVEIQRWVFIAVLWCAVVCCYVVRLVPIETHFQDKDHLLLQREK